MSQVEQVVYLADDGEWRFWDSELPYPNSLEVPQREIPCAWDPSVKAELSEWLPLPTKRFLYHKLVIPTGDWFPGLDGEARQIAGLKLIQAVVERALAGLEAPAENAPESEFREYEQWPEWLTGLPLTRNGQSVERPKLSTLQEFLDETYADLPAALRPQTHTSVSAALAGIQESQSFDEWHDRKETPDESSRD